MGDDEIIKKIIKHGLFEFQDGELRITGISAIVMPLPTQVILEHEICKRFGKEARDIIYYLAKYQAYSGAKLFHEQYGYDMRKVVEIQLQSCALMGMGKLQLMRFDQKESNAIIKFNPNPAAKIRKNLFGISKEASDNFGRGGMAGIFSYAFGKDMVGIETQCESSGKPYCLIEVKEKDNWDQQNPLVKDQFPLPEKNYESILDTLTALSLKKK